MMDEATTVPNKPRPRPENLGFMGVFGWDYRRRKSRSGTSQQRPHPFYWEIPSHGKLFVLHEIPVSPERSWSPVQHSDTAHSNPLSNCLRTSTMSISPVWCHRILPPGAINTVCGKAPDQSESMICAIASGLP